MAPTKLAKPNPRRRAVATKPVATKTKPVASGRKTRLKLATKSSYFEHPSDHDDAESAANDDLSDQDDDSDFQDSLAVDETSGLPHAESQHDEADEANVVDDDDNEKPRKRKQAASGALQSAKRSKTNVIDEDDDDDDEKPRKRKRAASGASQSANRSKKTKTETKTKAKSSEEGETVILLRAPSPGDTPYTPERIHPNTLAFLEDLRANNDRGWMRENDGAYRAAKSDFEAFVEKVTAVMIEDVDATIPELPLKDVLFRIYRDIRFSNDHTPYKTHLSAAWSRTGKKGPYACYYISISPGKSMVGGGLWHTASQPLGLLRRDIDRRPNRLKSVLTSDGFAAEFLDWSAGSDERAAIRAFAEHNKEDALKTAPKNYSKEHADIELLRLRSFTVSKRLTDEQVTAPDMANRLKDIFRNVEPFITYLNSVVMPDISGDAESSDTGGDGDASD